MREALEELLREMRAAAKKNLVWSKEDASRDYRLQSGATAETFEYVIGRLQEILENNLEARKLNGQ